MNRLRIDSLLGIHQMTYKYILNTLNVLLHQTRIHQTNFVIIEDVLRTINTTKHVLNEFSLMTDISYC